MYSPNKIVSFFDFDQTLTKRHTFAQFGLDDEPNEETKAKSFKEGQEQARGNKKTGIAEHFFHDNNHLTAIATYHNNPDFIAGFISGLLDKEVTLLKTVLSETKPTTAINYYTIAGEEAPLLISYIPAYKTFNETLSELQGKNEQITHLRKTLIEDKLIDEGNIINFYDDTKENFEKAKALPNINRFLVAKNNPSFEVIQEAKAVHQKKPISANFFMQVMSSTPAKIFGGLLLIAGLAALTLGSLGLGGVIAGLALIPSIALVAGGTSLSAVLSAGFWAASSKNKNNTTEPDLNDLNTTLLA